MRIAAALALALGLTAAASAATAETVTATRAIGASGVDFSQPAQVQQFYGRLEAAARDVCRTTPATATANATSEQRACIAAAIEDAVKQVNRRELSAAHEAPSATTLASR